MKIALTFLAASLAATTALTGIAIAQPHGGGGRSGPGFGLLQHDANADGRLTRAEFDASQKARFEKLDTDRDGAATREEVRSFHESQRAGARAAAVSTRFEKLDTDKNGQLSGAEFSARSDASHGAQGGRHRGGQRDRKGMAPGDGPDDAGQGLRSDANADGKLSLAEFSARGAQAFARADASKDGIVTIQELQSQRPGRP